MWTLMLLLTACCSLEIYSLSGPLQTFRISPRRFSTTEVASSDPGWVLSVWIKVVSPLTAVHSVFAAHIGEGALLTLSVSPESAFQGDMMLENNLLPSIELVRKSTDSWTLLALAVAKGDNGKALSMCAGVGGVLCVSAVMEERVEFGMSEDWEVIVNPMGFTQSGKNTVQGQIADFRLFRCYEKAEVLIGLLLLQRDEYNANEEQEEVLQVCRASAKAGNCGKVSFQSLNGIQGFVVSGSLLQTAKFDQAVSVLAYTDSKMYQLTLASDNKRQITACVSGPHLKPFCALSKTIAAVSLFTVTLCHGSPAAFLHFCIQKTESSEAECNSHLHSNEKETFARLEIDPSNASSLWHIENLTVLKTCAKVTEPPIQMWPRRLLAIAHYAQFSYRSYINAGENQYFTFQNNHLQAQYIFFELDNLGSGGDPDLYIEKPFGSGVSWGSSAVGPDSMTIYSTNVNIINQGGSMQGSWTVRVYGFTGGYTYELRITVACAETSTGCYCPLGEYPNPSTTSCSPCPATTPECSQPQNSGCVQITTGTSAAANPFNCYRCDPNLYTCTCHRTCSGCQGPGSGDCTACKSNAALSSGSPSSCVCGSSYYPDPDPAQCQACHLYCLNCADGSDLGCTACKSNAKLSSTAPCACVCNSVYFGTPDSCQPCDSSCAECAGATSADCSQCYSNASLASTPSGNCACNTGFFTLSDASSCKACHASCLTCSGNATTSCLSCHANAALSGAAPATCVCSPGYYGSPDARSCILCHTDCTTCSGSGSSACSGCFPSAHLSTTAPSACTCDSGMYPNGSVSACTLCHSYCANCASGSSSGCSSCKAHAALTGSAPTSCGCVAPYVGTPDNCQQCSVNCKTCVSTASTDCLTCYTSAELSGPQPNSCVCSNGYFGLPSSCAACDLTCLTCTSAGSSSCSNCKANASLASGVCTCVGGYFPNPTSANCALCDTTCLTCTGGLTTSCTGCKVHAHLSSAGPCDCVCDDGYFPNTTPASCFICDSTCAKCVGASASHCSGCFPNAQLISGSSPDACVCQDGYYPNTTPANCPKCSSTCLKCSGGLPKDCTACFPHANFFGGSSPEKCVCDIGYFPNTDSAKCSLCDVSCLNCLGGSLSQCSECKPNAALDGGSSPGKCLCGSGFFPNPTAGSCAACHATCKECVKDTASDCMECKNFAKLSAAAPSSCFCSPESFASPDASNCKVCALECLTCTEDGATKCLSCKPGASLVSTPPCECRCNDGYFPSPDPSLCILCNPACKKCASGTECTECKTHATLKIDTCLCDNGYFGNPDASNCLPCPEGCVSCDITKCEKCKSDWLIWTGACVSSCPYGYKADANSECQSVDLNPPVPSLTVTADNTLSVYFDKPMNCTVDASEINVDVIATGDVDISLTWKNPEFQSSQTLLIALIFESDYLPSGSEAALQFLAPEKVVDEYSIPIEASRLTGKLTPFGSSRSNSTGVLLQTSAAQQTAAASRGGVSAGAASSLINGNPACLMSLVNQLQLITYISMSKLPLPADFASTLAALNVGQMIPISLGDYLPNLGGNDTSQQPPDYVNDYGIGTLLFLPNSVTFLGTVCAILLSFVPVYMLSKVKVKFIADYFKAMLPSLKWNVPLQLWLTSYLDMGVFGLLQVANVKNSFINAYTGFNFIVGCVFCAFFAATPVLLLIFVLRNFNLISSRCDPNFNRRWGSLYLPFKSDYTLASVAYYLLFVIRRTVLAVTLVLFPDSLVVLALLNTVCALTVTSTQVFLYVAVYRPFAETIDFVDSVTVEASTFAVYLTASGFLLSLSDTLRDSLTVVGTWLVRVTIFVNVGVSVTRTVLNVTGLVKAYNHRIQEVKAKYEIRRIERISKQGEVSDMTDTRSTANWLAT